MSLVNLRFDFNGFLQVFYSFVKNVKRQHDILEATSNIASKWENIPKPYCRFQNLWVAVHEAIQDLQKTLMNAISLVTQRGEIHDTRTCQCIWKHPAWRSNTYQLPRECENFVITGARTLGISRGNYSLGQKNWITYEKETYARHFIWDYEPCFARTKPTPWQADRANFLYVFAKLALLLQSPQYVLSIVHLWAVYLAQFGFLTRSCGGTKSIFADLL